LLQLQAEEAPGDDAQRELHHVLVHVPHLALAPGTREPLGIPGHHLPVGRQALAVEGGLHEPALPQPGLALVGQQPVAQQSTQNPPLQRILGVVAVAGDEDVLDVVRVVEHVRLLSQVGEVHHVPVAAPGAVLGEGDGVLAILQGAAEQGQGAGPGGCWARAVGMGTS
jgi:hypothetical protein